MTTVLLGTIPITASTRVGTRGDKISQRLAVRALSDDRIVEVLTQSKPDGSNAWQDDGAFDVSFPSSSADDLHTILRVQSRIQLSIPLDSGRKLTTRVRPDDPGTCELVDSSGAGVSFPASSARDLASLLFRARQATGSGGI